MGYQYRREGTFGIQPQQPMSAPNRQFVISKLIMPQVDVYSFLNKGNSSIPLFKTHKSIEKNKSGLQTYTEENALTIRGEQRHNIKM